MIQQQWLIKHYEIALEELNKSVYKGNNKVFYNLDKHKTSIGWKSISNKVNGEPKQEIYNFFSNVIFISDKFKPVNNEEGFNTKLIAVIKRAIVLAYLHRELKLEYDMVSDGNLFFVGITEWLNRNKPIGAEDIKIKNNDMELYKLYYKDIYTNHLDNEDFENFSELISFLKNKNREFKRQITKLKNQIFNKSNGRFICQLTVVYQSIKETEIELETIYLDSPLGVVTQNIITINVAMYFEYKYVRTKCLDLIKNLKESYNG